MLLNCDLGESFGSWKMGMDEQVFPFIDQANIACGFHAGDPVVMAKTLSLAKQHGVQVGAHPSYPDLQGFGRRTMACSKEELVALIHYQIAALDGVAKCNELTVEYVKPHGALYNDMMKDAEIRSHIFQAIAEFYRPIKLMIQATADLESHKAEAEKFGIIIISEAFADRCYDDDGKLLARSKPRAVHSKEKMLAQVKQLYETSSLTTVSGKTLQINADSLCVHGDNIEGVKAIQAIREIIS